MRRHDPAHTALCRVSPLIRLRVAHGLSGLCLLAVFGVALLECLQAPGYLSAEERMGLMLLVWLGTLPSLLGILGRCWLVALLLALILPLAGVEAWLLMRYRAPLNGHTLTVILATDFTEARQFLGGSALYLISVVLASLTG